MGRQKEYQYKGYLTIYISLTLTVILSLCLTLIEGARQSTIRLETECVMDIALNSIMAEYHRELFEQYNLFFIDSSYGSAYPSYYNTEARLKYYLEQNLKPEEATYFDLLYKDMLGLETESVYIKSVGLATDCGGILFQKQAAETVFEDMGMGFANEVLGWVQTVESEGLLSRDIEAEKQAIDAQLASHNNTQRQLEEEQWITVKIKNPTEHMDTMRKQGVLKWVLEDSVLLSGQKVDLKQYISARRRRGQINQGNAVINTELSEMEKILCHAYMLQYTGHYGKEKENSLLKYQAEYLVAGKAKDTENLRKVANTICGIREVANTIYLYRDKEKEKLADSLAWVCATVILCPDLQPLFKASMLLGWAYIESLYDTKLILAGGRVPLMKTKADWHYDLDSILESVNLQLRKEYKTGNGLSYTDYLHILLYLTDMEKLTFRFMDLMEMDIRLTKGNGAFRMDACIGQVEAEALLQSGYGYHYSILRQKGYQ